MRAAYKAGDRVGRLTVVRDAGLREGSCIIYECLCDCGETVMVSRKQIKQTGKRPLDGCPSCRSPRPPGGRPMSSVLTVREAEALKLLDLGLKRTVVASIMGVSKQRVTQLLQTARLRKEGGTGSQS